MDLEEFLRQLPKAEMHIHLEGAFRWQTVRELHARRAELPEHPEWQGKPFRDFNAFRDIFLNVIRPATGTPEAVERHAFEVLVDLAEQNARYAEVLVGPGFHTARGMELDEVLDAILRGKQRAEAETGIVARFVLGLNRHLPVEQVVAEAHAILRYAGPQGTGLLCGLDLMGDENQGDAADYAELFAFARAQRLRLRAHSGELCGPEDIRRTLDCLRPEHLSHGARAAEDPALAAELAARGTYLHLCPTSNLMLKVAPGYAAHPLRALLHAGCKATINSDDPLLFGATLTDEYRHALDDMGLSPGELKQTVRTAFEGALLEVRQREGQIQELDRFP